MRSFRRPSAPRKANYRFARFQCGRLLLIKNRTAEAIAELSKTLTPEDRDTPRFMYVLGVAYAQAGNYPSARRYLKEAGQQAASQGQDQLMRQIETSLGKVENRVRQGPAGDGCCLAGCSRDGFRHRE